MGKANYKKVNTDPFAKTLKLKAQKSSARGIDCYFDLLQKYRKTRMFEEFALSLVNYFSCHFDILVCNQCIASGEASAKDMEKEKRQLLLKLDTLEHLLGNSYANLVLGNSDLNEVFHHMKTGARRLYSYTVTDRILHELILEYAALVVDVIFRSSTVCKQTDIRIE